TPIASYAATDMADVPLHKPDRIKAAVDEIRAIDADAWVVIAYGQKLPSDLLADRFAVNLHASRLPRWRGAAPINAAIVAGDRITGNSVIALADRMDAGVVYAQSERQIGPDQTAGGLHDLLAADGPAVIQDVLTDHEKGLLSPTDQDESLVTIAPKLSKADGWVDFADDAVVCAARINGLSPWPGVTASFRGEPLKLIRAIAEQAMPAAQEPGAVLDAAKGHIACRPGGVLRLIDVQPAGKRPMSWRDFANGRSVEAGEMITCPALPA
ncbi:MAG: methionyl-tRNA formyltransferase, partial [Phycisphaerae bacterium]|nr:methionyl-tRNA formyltransferase [Phycisphaerae bacterium]